MQSVGFFKALFGSCAGTEIFSALRRNNWPRVIWHLVILAFLLSLLISAGEFRRLAPRLAAVKNRFIMEFGSSLRCAPDGIRPEKDPQRARLLEAEPGVLLVYLGENPRLELSAAERSLAHRTLLVAAPRFFAFAVFSDNMWIGRWQDPADSGNFRCGDGELNALLSQRLAKAEAQWETPAMQLPVSYLFQMVRGTLSSGIFLMWFGTLLLLAACYTAIFAVVNRLVGGGARFSSLSLGEYWKIGIYAGFPPMLVASAFPAFDLPFLTYPTVYMIGLVVYWMIAAARVAAELPAQADPTPPTTAKDDDDENEQ